MWGCCSAQAQLGEGTKQGKQEQIPNSYSHMMIHDLLLSHSLKANATLTSKEKKCPATKEPKSSSALKTVLHFC